MTVTNKAKQSLKQGHLHVKPCKLSYRGIPAWFKLGTVSSEIPATSGLACTRGITMFSARRTGAFWLACDHCSIRTDMQCSTLFLKGKWATLKCQYCGSCSSARKWSCTCGLPWHGCCDHAKRGFACRTRPRRCNTGTSQVAQPGPSNCRPAPTLPVNVPGPRTPCCVKRPHVACGPSLQNRAVSARAAASGTRKRKASQSRAADLAAVARFRDARKNPVPPEYSQVSTPRREKNQGDATPPWFIHI